MATKSICVQFSAAVWKPTDLKVKSTLRLHQTSYTGTYRVTLELWMDVISSIHKWLLTLRASAKAVTCSKACPTMVTDLLQLDRALSVARKFTNVCAAGAASQFEPHEQFEKQSHFNCVHD